MSPSAISHRINGLEDELGFNLFERFHRKIRLTSEGERIYMALQSSLALINQEVAEIRNNEISGSLTVYSRPSIAQCWLVPKLADFHQRYPSINLDILTGNEYINFNNYNIDLAIYYDNQPPEGLSCEQLMSETIVPVCSREYAFSMTCLIIRRDWQRVRCCMTSRHGITNPAWMSGIFGPSHLV